MLKKDTIPHYRFFYPHNNSLEILLNINKFDANLITMIQLGTFYFLDGIVNELDWPDLQDHPGL